MQNDLQYTSCLICGGTEATTVQQTKPQMSIENTRTFSFLKCAHCDLVYLNPRLDPAYLDSFYPSYYLPYRGAEAWGKYRKLVANGLAATDNKRVKITEKYLHINGGQAVFDVGCGHPTFLEKLVNRREVNATGIDFSDEGWRDDPKRWHGMTLIREDPVTFTPEQTYDVITMWHYLEHDYDPAQTLSKLRHAAHSETRLIIEVPNYDSISRKRFGKYWEGFHTPRHTAIYTPSTLREILQRNGWDVENQWSNGTLDPYTLWWMSRMEAKNIDWRESMEQHFPGFLAGKMLTWPLFALKRWLSLGVQMAVATPKKH